jgi:mono/diheme cytochrome c family protein
MKRFNTGLAITVMWPGLLAAQGRPGAGSARQLPEGTGRDVTQKVCGATCHGAEMMMNRGRSREQWTAVTNEMVSRGAKATPAELAEIVEYLSSNFGPGYSPASAPGARPGAPPPTTGHGPGPLGAGAADSHVVDERAADRGRTVYIAECITCHGNKGRGGNENLPANQRGPDLVRSLIVLHDRYASQIGPFLAKGHPLQSGRPSRSLTTAQVGDVAHFLHRLVYNTLRSGPELKVQNVLTGDPKAGAVYFNGAGKCSTCHSPTGDLAHVGSKYDPPTLQTKFLFPRTVGFGRRGRGAPAANKPVTVTVTSADGETVDGVLDTLDDFYVSLRDKEGEYRSFKITPSVKVVKHDPYEMHVTLLDQYTDKNIHDVVAYLESLK